MSIDLKKIFTNQVSFCYKTIKFDKLDVDEQYEYTGQDVWYI